MKRTLSVLLVGLFFLTGCGIFRERIQTLTARTYQAPYEEVWGHLVDTLHDRKELLSREDMKEGVLATEWVVRKRSRLDWLRGIPSQRYRYLLRLDKVNAEETMVEVRVDLEVYQGDGVWGNTHPSDQDAKSLFSALEKKGGLAPLHNY